MKINNYPRGVEVVVSAIIENKEEKILLTKSPKWHNKWGLPVGHIDPGESITQTALREAEEETGLKLLPINIIDQGELINSNDFHRQAHFIYFDVYCKQIGGIVKLDQNELNDYKWLSPEEALNLDLAETYPETIQKFVDYLNTKS